MSLKRGIENTSEWEKIEIVLLIVVSVYVLLFHVLPFIYFSFLFMARGMKQDQFCVVFPDKNYCQQFVNICSNVTIMILKPTHDFNIIRSRQKNVMQKFEYYACSQRVNIYLQFKIANLRICHTKILRVCIMKLKWRPLYNFNLKTAEFIQT